MQSQQQKTDPNLKGQKSGEINFSAHPKEFRESYARTSTMENVLMRPNARIARLRMCEEHQGQKIEFYCRSHNSVGCTECNHRKHRSCFGLLPIADAAKDVFKSEGYIQLKRRVHSGHDTLKEKKWKDDSHLVHSNRGHPHVTRSRKSFTLDRNTPLTLSPEVDAKPEDREQAGDGMNEIKMLVSIVENTKSEVDAFILIKSNIVLNADIKSEEPLQKQPRKLSVKQHVTGETVLSLMGVKRHADLARNKSPIRQNEASTKSTVHGAAGSLTIESGKTATFKYLLDIDLKKVNLCSVFGMAVSNNGSLFLCDTNFPRIIVCDVDDKYAYEIALKCEAWDIAFIPNTDYFVTSPVFDDHMIQFVDSNRRAVAKVVKQKHVDQGGVAVTQDTILIGGHNKVKVCDLKGNQIKSMTGIQGKISYLHVSPRSDQILVSEREIHHINEDNNVVFSVKLPNNRIPGKPASDIQGNVYIPDLISHTIYRLEKSGKNFDPVLKASDGVHLPTALCFNKICSKLYVSNNSGNSIKVFAVSF